MLDIERLSTEKPPISNTNVQTVYIFFVGVPSIHLPLSLTILVYSSKEYTYIAVVHGWMFRIFIYMTKHIHTIY